MVRMIFSRHKYLGWSRSAVQNFGLIAQYLAKWQPFLHFPPNLGFQHFREIDCGKGHLVQEYDPKWPWLRQQQEPFKQKICSLQSVGIGYKIPYFMTPDNAICNRTLNYTECKMSTKWISSSLFILKRLNCSCWTFHKTANLWNTQHYSCMWQWHWSYM